MQERFHTRLLQLLEPLDGAPVLVAVSGGVDSMVLAELFARSGVPYAVAHGNFTLRGAESDADEDFVREWAGAHDAPFHVRRFDTVRYAAQTGSGIELAARELRYRWFDDLCRTEGYAAVAVAHQADDNAETLLLHLLRGAGTRGLSGMRAQGTLPVPDSRVPLLRPLLGFTRAEIAAFAAAEGIAWREDRTNADPAYRRNHLRHAVFPLLKEINPACVEAFGRAAAHVAEVDAIAEDCYRDWREQVFDGSFIDTAVLMALPHRDYILYRLLEEAGLHAAQVAELQERLRVGSLERGKRYPAGLSEVVVEAGGLRVLRSAGPFAPQEPFLIPGPGIFGAGLLRLCVSEEPWSPDRPLTQPEGTLILDAAGLRWPLAVRPWRPGDRFRPLGAPGSRKLSDVLKDLRLPVADKARAAVLVPTSSTSAASPAPAAAVPGSAPHSAPDPFPAREVLALLVPGPPPRTRLADRLRVTPATARIFRLTLLGA